MKMRRHWICEKKFSIRLQLKVISDDGLIFFAHLQHFIVIIFILPDVYYRMPFFFDGVENFKNIN